MTTEALARAERGRRKKTIPLEAAAEHLSVSQSYVRRLVAEGQLKGVRIGRRLVFRPGDLDEFIEQRLTSGDA